MKKIIALLLVLTMALSLAACNKKTNDGDKTEAPIAANALEVLNKAYESYENPDMRPPLGGGSGDTMNWEGPGEVAATDTDTLTGTLNVPADQVANVVSAASAMHLMNGNNLTVGVFQVTGDAEAFANAMVEALKNGNFVCGWPEKMFVARAGEFVVAGIGLGGQWDPEAAMLNDFIGALKAAYPTFTIVAEEIMG